MCAYVHACMPSLCGQGDVYGKPVYHKLLLSIEPFFYRHQPFRFRREVFMFSAPYRYVGGQISDQKRWVSVATTVALDLGRPRLRRCSFFLEIEQYFIGIITFILHMYAMISMVSSARISLMYLQFSPILIFFTSSIASLSTSYSVGIL